MATDESPSKSKRLSGKAMAKKEFKHRLSDPQLVLQVWKCVNTIRHQRQKPTPDRLTKFIVRELDTPLEEAEKTLENLQHDGMLMVHGTTHKYNKGLMEDSFTVPSREEVVALHGSHDWYCFECHKPGEDMFTCDSCWRVYHTTCVTHNPDSEDAFVCKVCQGKSSFGVRELNRLLAYTIARLKERTRELYHVLRGPEHEELVELFVFKQMDLGKMQEKVKRKLYKSLDEFHADAHLILHNVLLVFGDTEDNQLGALAHIMIKDCTYDLDEIRLCKDCYYMSNARPKDWFCEPCKMPHDLVYAKQKGFTYWPAKVIKVAEKGYDVRFFGRLHQRATVSKTFVLPVEGSNIQKLVAKKTSSFTKACQELKLHQDKLEKHTAVQAARREQGLPSDDDDNNIPSDDETGETTEEEEMVEEGVDDRDTSSLYPDNLDASNLDASNLDASVAMDTSQDGGAGGDGGSGHVGPTESDNEAAAIPPSKKLKRDDKLSSPSDEDRVTSSDDHRPPKIVLKIQTPKSLQKTPKTKMPPPSKKRKSSSTTNTPATPSRTPTTPVTPGDGKCNCKEKHKVEVVQLKKDLKAKYAEEKSKALKEQSSRLRKDFEMDKQQAVSRAMANVQREVDKAKRQVEDTLKPEYLEEMKKLAQKHQELISQTKKKQWCFNCEQEAMYHCCWNTSYCSTKCQQDHWHREHKRVCRRKR